MNNIISCSISKEAGSTIAEQVKGLPKMAEEWLGKSPAYIEYSIPVIFDLASHEVIHLFSQGEDTILLVKRVCHYEDSFKWGKKRPQVKFEVIGFFKGRFMFESWKTIEWNFGLTHVTEDRFHTPAQIIKVEEVEGDVDSSPKVKVFLEANDGYKFTKKLNRR